MESEKEREREEEMRENCKPENIIQKLVENSEDKAAIEQLVQPMVEHKSV